MSDRGMASGQGVGDRPALTMSRAMFEYLTQVMSETEHLVFGNPHGFRFDHRLPLQDVWVPQEVTVVSAGRALVNAPPTERMALNRRDGLQIDAALNMGMFRKAVVIGRPGHGKTTLCRRLAYKQALEAKMNGRGWIPIRVPAHIVNHTGVWSSFDDLLSRIPLIQHNPALREQIGEAGILGHLWIFVDGLDEVDEALLPDLRSRLTSVLLASPNRVTLTCRAADYLGDHPIRRLDGLPVLELSPFSESTLDFYIDNWHQHAGRGRSEWSRTHLAATQGLLDAHSELRDLASSPLLAAVLCVVESRSRQATVGRAAVLRQAVEYLLLRPEWRHGATSAPPRTVSLDAEVLLEIAGRLAYNMLTGTVTASASGAGAGVGTCGDRRPLTTRAVLRRFVTDQLVALGAEDAADVGELDAATTAYLDRLIGVTGAGLLQARSSGVYEFAHRSFQEYLAAGHIAGYLSHRDRLDLARRPSWREVFLLTASIAQITRDGLTDLLMLVRTLLREARGPRPDDIDAEQAATGACLAAEMLAELGTTAVRRYGWETAVADRDPDTPDDQGFAGLWTLAVNTVFALTADLPLSRATRIRAMCVASRIRDPRFLDERGNRHGDLGDLVEVPGGRGRVGTDRPLSMYEVKQVPSSPPLKVSVEAFEIGRYLVTNLEYQAFVDDGGYADPRWWRSVEAARWREHDPAFIDQVVALWESQKDLNFAKEFSEPEFAAYAQDASVRIARRTMIRDLPLYWRDTRFNLPTAPVVGVNLWEAQAYCAWLQDRWLRSGKLSTGDVVTLPTEIEWEWAAARGWTQEPRTFPWGQRFDDTRSLVRDFGDPDNPRITHFGGIPVGFCSIGEDTGDDGPQDMGGNVWEWVTSLSLPWNSREDRERSGGLDKRGVRGSSWFSREPMATHVSFRLDDPPCNAYWDLGFRVVVRRAGR